MLSLYSRVDFGIYLQEVGPKSINTMKSVNNTFIRFCPGLLWNATPTVSAMCDILKNDTFAGSERSIWKKYNNYSKDKTKTILCKGCI